MVRYAVVCAALSAVCSSPGSGLRERSARAGRRGGAEPEGPGQSAPAHRKSCCELWTLGVHTLGVEYRAAARGVRCRQLDAVVAHARHKVSERLLEGGLLEQCAARNLAACAAKLAGNVESAAFSQGSSIPRGRYARRKPNSATAREEPTRSRLCARSGLRQLDAVLAQAFG